MKLSIFDYLVIGLYFAFIMAAGVLFRRLSKNTSDYFRAGGSMPWWITGAALFMGFSAWTFTAAAGHAYHDGTFVLVLYLTNVVGYITVFFLGARPLRRLRVITWMEAVYERYGWPTQQFYTWIKLPLLILLAGVGLNAVAVFMSAVFGLGFSLTLVVCGAVITLVSPGAVLVLKIESAPLLRFIFPVLAGRHSTGAQADGLFILTTIGVILIGTAWFFLAGLFYRASSQEHQAHIEKLRANLRTPVDPHVECISDHRPHLYLILGRLSAAYGVAVMFFAFIPNLISGRVGFLFCGGVLLVVGLLLLASHRRLRKAVAAAKTT